MRQTPRTRRATFEATATPAVTQRRVRYPVTLLLGLQYLPLAVFPAIVNRNPYLPFILSVVAAGLATSFVVERLFQRRALLAEPAKGIRYPKPASCWLVAVIGAGAVILDGSLGGGSYATQVGTTVASPLTTLLTPLVPWLLFGCGFAFASWRAGVMSRWSTTLLIAFAVVVELIATLTIAILAPLMELGFAIAGSLVLVGFFRPRWLWVGLAVAVLVWPVLYAARNATRQQVSATYIDPQADPTSRLREDLLLEQASIFGQSLHVAQPGPIDILRFGLVPRFLDPGRGDFVAGKALNTAVGGSSNSSLTFTLLGTLWSLNGGYAGVVIYVICVAGAFSLVVRRLSPARVAFAILMISNLLWIEGIYPANLTGMLQGLVSLAVALGLAMQLGTRRIAGDLDAPVSETMRGGVSSVVVRAGTLRPS
jgi:hypothetical protein